MEHTLDQIIQLDREAQRKLNDARQQAAAMTAAAREKQAALLKQLDDTNANELDAFTQKETATAAEAKERTDAHIAREIARLEAFYQKNQARLVDALVTRIIGDNT